MEWAPTPTPPRTCYEKHCKPRRQVPPPLQPQAERSDYDEKGECAETIGVDEEASMDKSKGKSKDQDRGKGAIEQNQQNQGGNTSMQGQLGAP